MWGFSFEVVQRADPVLVGHVNALSLEVGALSALVAKLIEGSKTMSVELETLKSEVAEMTTVVGSAIVLIDGIEARITAAVAAATNGDTNALPALAAVLKSERELLAAAVAANTPTVVEPVAAPVAVEPVAAPVAVEPVAAPVAVEPVAAPAADTFFDSVLKG